jgi:hypothetical protein
MLGMSRFNPASEASGRRPALVRNMREIRHFCVFYRPRQASYRAPVLSHGKPATEGRGRPGVWKTGS